MTQPMQYKNVNYFKGFEANAFASNPLDRCGNFRKDVDLMKKYQEDPTSLFLPFYKLKPLVTLHEGKYSLSFLPFEKIQNSSKEGKIDLNGQLNGREYKENSLVFLGKQKEIAHYAIEISNVYEKEDEFTSKNGGEFGEIRGIMGQLEPTDGGILAQARALLDWNIRHPFCAKCGGLTSIAEGGVKRICKECKTPHYPRTDSVAIMMVVADRKKEDGEMEEVCLLATRAGGYKNMFTCLSGFIDVGESLEEAVKREVEEESGINLDVKQMWYHSSQPWPFPSQLMFGCFAKTNYSDFIANEKELGEVNWFTRSQVRELLERSSGPLSGSNERRVPPPTAIAHQLIKFWSQNE